MTKAQTEDSVKAQLEEEMLGIGTKLSLNADITVSELPVPEWLAGTTKAKTLKEYMQLTTSGEVVTEVIFNADPVHEGEIMPSTYQQRTSYVWQVLAAFTGAIALAGPNEVLMSFDPAVAAYKVRYTKANAGPARDKWVEWNWIRGKYTPSGRRQFDPTERVRTPGIRIPQSVCVALDSITTLFDGAQITVGLLGEPNLGAWLQRLFVERITVGEYLTSREEAFEAAANNKAAFEGSKHPKLDAYSKTIWVIDPGGNGRHTQLTMVPDGAYMVYSPTQNTQVDSKLSIRFSKDDPVSLGMLAEYASRGFSIKSKN